MAVVKFSNGYEWHTGELTRATNDVYGVVKLATADDVRNGTNDYKAVTPIILNEVFDEKILEIKETGLSYDDITNCLTEIPQDIKLELVDGTLTLKAGSKVYVPNGSGKFDEKIASIDCTPTEFSGTGQYIVFDNGSLSGNTLRFAYKCESSETAPTDTSVCWYDTTNNIIQVYQNGEWTGMRTLPLGLVTFESGKIVSIDQVFNGFGYIGSTVFALPGVKGLIPNGRNADGSLKSIFISLTSVKTGSRNLNSPNVPVWLRDNSNIEFSSGITYDENTNFVIGVDEITGKYLQFATADMKNGVISNFKPKTTFHAVDYNDFKRLDDEAVKVNGDQEIDGVKTFNSTVNVSNNMTIRSYGSNDSGRLQIRAQPSDNVIRGTFAITDAYEGYDGWVSQMVSRSGDLSTDVFNTLRVSEKGVEYIREESNGDVISNHKLLDTSVLTNCITEIPQDINLELVDGTLTLKAGSKTRKATGVNSFVDVNNTSDKTIINTWGSASSGMVFFNIGGDYNYYPFERIHSGTTNPTGLSGNSHINYNTTDGYFYHTITAGSEWTKSTTACLPLACVTWDNNNKITSIDQVFNGFGYIGHSLYMLPNVKFLCADGFNSDGSYKNIEYIVPSVKVKTYPYSITNAVLFSDNGTIELGVASQVYEVENTLPTPASSYERVYVRNENQWYYHVAGGTSWLKLNGMCVLGKGEKDGIQGITSFQPKTTFHAVDYNDFKRLDDEVVKTIGNQTVGGNKNFTGTLTQNGNVVITNKGGTFSGVIKTSTTDFITKTNDTGHLTFVGGTAWNKGAALNLAGMSESGREGCFELVAHNGTNSKYLLGKPDGTLTWDGNTVATTNNTVNLTGNQTINGEKTYNSQSFVLDKTELGKYREVYCKNEDGNARIGFLRFYNESNGTHKTGISCVNNSNSPVGEISISVNSDGTVATAAPTPPISDNSTKISTTNWFNQKIQVVSTLPASPNSNVYYFVTG